MSYYDRRQTLSHSHVQQPRYDTSNKRKSFGFGSYAGGKENDRRQSFGGRRSISMNTGMTEDQRQLTNKANRRESSKKIVEYLITNNYGQKIPELHNQPLMKEFIKIFRFLYNRLDPNQHDITGNVQEEIPILMRELDYPLPINKSALLAWTPRTWPCLLGCLDWLVELNKYFDEVGDYCFFPNDLEGKSESQMDFESISEAYSSPSGEEEYVVSPEFIKRYQQIEHDIEMVQDEIKEKERRLHDMLEKESELKELEKAKVDYLSDIEKYKRIIAPKVQQLRHEEMKEHGIQQSLEERERELNDKEKHRQELITIIDNQEMPQSEIERKNREKQQLREKLEKVRQQKEEAEKLKWERDNILKKQIELLEEGIRSYNQMFPFLEKTRIEFKMHVNIELPSQCEKNPQMLTLDTSMKTGLSDLIKRCNQKIAELENAIDKGREHLEQLSEDILEAEEEITKNQERLRKAKALFQQEKSEFNLRKKLAEDEIERYEDELNRIDISLRDTKLETLEIEFKHQIRQIENEKEELEYKIKQAHQLAQSHKTYVEQQFSKLETYTSEKLREIASTMASEKIRV